MSDSVEPQLPPPEKCGKVYRVKGQRSYNPGFTYFCRHPKEWHDGTHGRHAFIPRAVDAILPSYGSGLKVQQVPA